MSPFKTIGTVLAASAAAAYAVRTTIRGRRRIDLRGRHVLLTGATRGLGLELARRLCSHGVKLSICGRTEADLRDVQDELRSAGCAGVFAAVCDATDRSAVYRFVGLARDTLGPVDVLVNNAGMITVAPFDATGRDDFKQAFGLHVSGPLEFMRACLADIRARKGRIVNVCSIGGLVGLPHMSAYSASKHALAGLTQSVGAELAAEGVRVTLVCPGTVRTGSPRHAGFKGRPEEEYAWFAAGDNLPLASVSTPRLALQIVDALVHGDAVLVTPWSAKLLAGFHGLARGVAQELSAVQARTLLPRYDRPGDDVFVDADDPPVPGRDADSGRLPGPLAAAQDANEQRFNQV